jgi:hypothetical protein
VFLNENVASFFIARSEEAFIAFSFGFWACATWLEL